MTRRWKARALLGLKLAVSVALIAYLLSRIGVRSLVEVMASASPGALLLAATIVLVSQALGAWQWGRLLAVAGVHIPARRVVAYTFAGTFLNLALPGGVGGDVARVLGVMQESRKKAAIVGATVVERLLGGAALGLLAVVAFLGAESAVRETRGGLLGVVVAGCALLSVAAVALLLGPGARGLLHAIGRVMPAAIEAKLERWDNSLARLGASRRSSFLIVALAIQSLRILAHAQVARALDIDVGLRYFFLFVPLLAIGVALPISIGGIGVRETLGAVLFGLLGIDAAKASAMQLLTYLVAVAVSLPGALLLLGLRQAPGAEDRVHCR